MTFRIWLQSGASFHFDADNIEVDPDTGVTRFVNLEDPMMQGYISEPHLIDVDWNHVVAILREQ